ncbi:hypothetical protein PV797_18380 [Clostridiaceae bacterium M8S5]|nr:hypothetical protein PV797_18380 [Clostridiaceae bacterium M8S5]
MDRKGRLAIAVALTIAMIATGCTQGKKVSSQESNAKQKLISKGENGKKKSADVPKDYVNIIRMLDNIRDFRLPYWGGYDIKDKQVVFFSDKNEKAVIWNIDGNGKKEIVNKTELPNDKILSYYSKGKIKGKDTIFVKYEGDDNLAFNFAVHEGYHFYGQKWIDKIGVEKSLPRGTIYPENVMARYYMNEADTRLREKIDGKNEKGDSEALYYFNKLKKEYNGDLEGNLNISISEGTATFLENMYLAVALKPELKGNLESIAKYAYELNKKSIKGTIRNKTEEFYHTASLPLFYLAMKGKHDLIDTIAKGKHPLELLTNITKETKAIDNKKLKQEIDKYYEETQKEASKKIEKLYKIMKLSDYTKVVINQNIFPGSMEYGEFINFKVSNEYKTLNTNTTGTANRGDKSKIELRGQDTINSDDGMYYIIYIKKSNIKENGGKLNIKTEHLTIQDVDYTKKDSSYVIEK